MKKSFVLSFVLAAALLAACDKKENSYDFAQILYPEGYAVIYADQAMDSLKFATTYDWSLTLSSNWMTINADSMVGTVPQGYYMVSKVNVYFEANNTDAVRTGYVSFLADGKTISAVYVQQNWLNIQRPIRVEEQFVLTDTARQARDSIVFRTYSNDWTLAFSGGQPSWVRLAEDAATSGRAGEYTVYYELDENTSADERSAVLQLQSRGVTTDIRIRQQGTASDGQ